ALRDGDPGAGDFRSSQRAAGRLGAALCARRALDFQIKKCRPTGTISPTTGRPKAREREDEAMTDTKVYLLDCGTLVIVGFHSCSTHGPLEQPRFRCYAVLIDHQDRSCIFDTGYDHAHVGQVLHLAKPMQTREQTIHGALAKSVLRPPHINYVIN